MGRGDGRTARTLADALRDPSGGDTPVFETCSVQTASVLCARKRLLLAAPERGSGRTKFLFDDEYGEASADAAEFGAGRLEVNAKELFEAYGDLRQILRRRRDAAKGGA